MPSVFAKPEKPMPKKHSKPKNAREIGNTYKNIDLPVIKETYETPSSSYRDIGQMNRWQDTLK